MGDVQLLIVMKPDGKILVNGPLEQKVLCLGMLEVAKNLVHDFVPSPILKPTNGMIPNPKKE